VPNAIQRHRGDPLSQLTAWRQSLTADAALLLVDFELACWWLPAAPALSLTAVYCWQHGELLVSVTDQALQVGGQAPARQFALWVEQFDLAVARPGQVLPLQPTYIPKPWGQEIWYTGVEERGICSFQLDGRSLPIPWLQAVMPDAAAGSAGLPLVLLKILDPCAEEVIGDLYFELHEEKREVYVVTRVDREAWPDGVGYIRYGFDPQRIAAAGSEEQFRQQYRAAVAAYENVRRAIDDLPDGQTPAADLQRRERELRAAMDAFTHLRPLRVGDVVVVPLLMPHSLQHGVRTIEFQTPVYERQILSFAQRVLTQHHWDTQRAVAQMRLTPPPTDEFAQLPGAEGVRVERIVDFPDFEVRRIRVEAGAALALPACGEYALVMVVDGELALDGLVCVPEEALFLPPGWSGHLACAQAARPLVLLLAMPRR
jgi:hypothetical protein